MVYHKNEKGIDTVPRRSDLIAAGAKLLQYDRRKRKFRENYLNQIKKNYSKKMREDIKCPLWLMLKSVEDFEVECGINQ